MPSKLVPAQQLAELEDRELRLAAAKDAEIAELRRQNAEKADLLDRCIALFRKNGDYPILTQEIVAALTSAPQEESR